jgi:indole-3-glycerol phosphate synthase
MGYNTTVGALIAALAMVIGVQLIRSVSPLPDDASIGVLFVGFLALGEELGITCLVEAHTTEEVRRALDAGASLVGVNNRNLKTLDVDLSHFEEMAETIGDAAVKVAESGILGIEDAVRMRSAGADAVLVGELLVRHGDPQAAVAALRAVE